MADITVIILTFNEEKHIARCIRSITSFAKDIIVVDSYSTDATIKIAADLGAKVYQHEWTNYSLQFNWALENCPIQTEWLMRLDADEYALPELSEEINTRLPRLENSISGIYIKLRVIFLKRWLKHGGYPIWLLRIWRNGKGHCENKWMDEHIKLIEGSSVKFSSDFVDENLNSLSWWISKHNNYSNREMIDLILLKYNSKASKVVTPKFTGTQEQRKRWLKLQYAKFPLFIRPVIYFIYVYFIRAGFMDGYAGLIRHILLAFWYRFLVDSKIYEINKLCGNNLDKIKETIYNEYGHKI